MASKLYSWLTRWTKTPEPESDEASLIGASNAWDGYVREAAVLRLATFDSAASLRAIVPRLNDWVPQVRSAANLALETFLRAERVPALLECLDSLLALERKTRADHREILRQLTAVFIQPENRSLLEARFAASNRLAARFLFSMLARSIIHGDDPLLALAAHHRDVAIRVLAVSALRDFTDEATDRLLGELLNDSHAKVRAEALRECWKRASLPERNDELMRTGLLDRAESVRMLACLLADRAGSDARNLLSRWIDDESVRATHPAGMAGLAVSLNYRAGLAHARACIDHPRASVRSAGIAAWAALDRDTAGEAAAALLTDSSNKVAQCASRLLARGDVAATPEQLEKALASALRLERIRRTVTIANLLHGWSRLEAFLRCLEQARAPKDISMLRSALEDWMETPSIFYTTCNARLAESIFTCLDRIGKDKTHDRASATIARLTRLLRDPATPIERAPA